MGEAAGHPEALFGVRAPKDRAPAHMFRERLT
jgi:hypothetical protein